MAKQKAQITKKGEVHIPMEQLSSGLRWTLWIAIGSGLGLAYLIWGRKKK